MNDDIGFVDLGAYVDAVRRGYRFVLLCTLLAGLLGLAISLATPRTYEAESRVALVRTGTLVNFDPRIKTVSDVLDPSVAADQTARRKGLGVLAEDAEIASSVANALGSRLTEDERQISALTENVDVVMDGDVIRIKARSMAPEAAALIANAWAAEYERRINTIYSETPLSLAEVKSQEDAARRDYDAKEAALAAYLRTNPTDALERQRAEKQAIIDSLKSGGEKGTSYLDSLIRARQAVLNQQAAAKPQRLADLYTLQNKIDRLLGDAAALRTRLSASGPAVARRDDLALLLLEASAFSTWTSLPMNLQVPMEQLAPGLSPADSLQGVDDLMAALTERRKAASVEIAALSRELMENAGQETRDAQAQALDKLTAYAAANVPISTVITDIEKDVNDLQAQLEQERAGLRELTQARDLAWTTYTTLATKSAEVAVAEQSKGSVVRLAATATPPDRPVAPRLGQNLMLSLVLGLALGLTIVLLRQYADHSLRSQEQATAALGLPVVGVIPSGSGGESFPGLTGPGQPADEAFRFLRHKLLARADTSKVLLVTSALPGEGKSTVALGLAASLAGAGRSVVLLDANLRHPSLHNALGLSNGRGLSDLLQNGGQDCEPYLQQSTVPGLRLLAAGPRPGDPTLLLESPRMADLLQTLRAATDVVIVDAPAALGLADVVTLSPLCDAALLVIRSGKTQLQDALAAKAQLLGAGARLASVVLNRATDAAASLSASYARASDAGRIGLGTRLGRRLASLLGLDA
jgi:capsular exopolysaccharide synthesis family protein